MCDPLKDAYETWELADEVAKPGQKVYQCKHCHRYFLTTDRGREPYNRAVVKRDTQKEIKQYVH